MASFNKSEILSIFLAMGSLLGCMSAVAAPAAVEFTANIAYEGACDIDVNPVVFNNAEPILPSQIEAKDPVTKQPFDLTLSGCKGIGLTPKITISGSSNTDLGEALFLDAVDSTAVGYGILLETNGNTAFQENLNLAANKEIIAVEDWDKYTKLDSINGKLPMMATLTCGDCSVEERIGGELKANVTFNFKYE